MPLNIVSPPNGEPVDLDYAKNFLRVDIDSENDLISDLIASARLRVEALTGHALLTRRVVETFEASSVDLLLKLQTITDVHELRFMDEAGHALILSVDMYRVNLRSHPAKVSLNSPLIGNLEGCQIEVEYSAGYGAHPDDVPMPFRQAILLLLAQSYEHRGDDETRSAPLMVDALLQPYRWMRI